MVLARRMIDVAAEAGCDAVKFQLFRTESLVAPGTARAPYQGSGSQQDLLRGLELSPADMAALAKHAAAAGIDCVASPFDLASAKALDDLDVPFLKISSGEITNLLLLRQIGRLGRPVVLSTGTATLGEVVAATAAVAQGQAVSPQRKGRWDGPPSFHGDGIDGVILLQCVTAYPAPVDSANLRAMAALRAATGCPVGYSEHTTSTAATVAAVAMGAVVLEKHLTLDKSLPGPDHRSSADPQELAAIVRAVREAEAALGDGIKRPAACEGPNAAVVRRRLCAARDLPARHVLTEDDLLPLRTAEGIGADCVDRVLGRPLRRDVRRGQALHWEML